jgi:hypothetical protein
MALQFGFSVTFFLVSKQVFIFERVVKKSSAPNLSTKGSTMRNYELLNSHELNISKEFALLPKSGLNLQILPPGQLPI